MSPFLAVQHLPRPSLSASANCSPGTYSPLPRKCPHKLIRGHLARRFTSDAYAVCDDSNSGKVDSLVHEIGEMADTIGKRLYRGVLKTVARVWNPTEIHDPVTLQSVLNEMRTADGELRRLDAALNQVEPGTLTPILRSLRLNSLEQVASLDDLRKIVREVERAAGILAV